ncbi:MAG: hypothetical protein EKK42_11115 [Pseudonocardiaceae bacterium]|nr:MAG: hypothetical protein EKK42_11115 [Pseudonocardiaceae bacterium]
MSSTEHGQQDRIAFVQSLWHREIVDRCRDSFLAEMGEHGVPAERIDLWSRGRAPTRSPR